MSDDITLAEAQEQRDLYLAASRAIAIGKSYTIGNRQLTRLDSTEVRNMLTYWQRAVRSLSAAANSSVDGGGFKVAKWT